MCGSADLVVVGRVRTRNQKGWTTVHVGTATLQARDYVVNLEVEKYLKGGPAGNEFNFTFALSDTPVGHKGVPVGQFGVFFLGHSQLGYKILDPYYPYVPAAPGAPGVDGSCTDRVTGELAYVFESPDPSVESRWARFDAVRALETLQSSRSTAALRKATRDKDSLVRIWAMSALLSRNDLSMLEEVEKLRPIPSEPHVQNLTAQLRFGIERVRDARAIPQLARLLQNRDVNIRRGAISALRGIGGEEVVKALKAALENTDDEVVWTAILGLAEITGDLDHGPGAQEEFRGKQKEQYLNYWLNWAKSRK
jgi:hypothetical protein